MTSIPDPEYRGCWRKCFCASLKKYFAAGRRSSSRATLTTLARCRCCPSGWPRWCSAGRTSAPVCPPRAPSSRWSPTIPSKYFLSSHNYFTFVTKSYPFSRMDRRPPSRSTPSPPCCETRGRAMSWAGNTVLWLVHFQPHTHHLFSLSEMVNPDNQEKEKKTLGDI